jgi:4-hydroxy-4-methyl-2-oxoglutarate aldolase
MTDEQSPHATSYTDELRNIGVATLHEANHRRGLMTGLHIACGGPFAGRAVTVTIPAGDNLGIHWLLQEFPPGSVLCVASRGEGRYGCLGELIARSARALGAAAMVIDDAIRDIAQLDEVGFSIAARGVSAQGTVKRRIIDIGENVAIGGVAVGVGDWIVGDRDGVVAIVGSRIDEVLKGARERLAKEEIIGASLDLGRTTVDVLGLAGKPRALHARDQA